MGYAVEYQSEEEVETQIRLTERLLQLEKAVNGYGVSLECHTDFSVFREIADSIPDISELTGIFDNRYCEIDASNGLWIKAFDGTGKVVHVQAIRHDDLTGTTLQKRWLSEALLYAPAGYDIEIDNSDFQTAPISHIATGNVCYLGEYWLDKAYRRTGLAAYLCRYGTLTALIQFSADFLYAFSPPKMVARGWAARAGFLHMHPWAPRWRIRNNSKYYDEYLIWVSGQELTKLWTTDNRDIDILGRENISNHNRDPAPGHMASQ